MAYKSWKPKGTNYIDSTAVVNNNVHGRELISDLFKRIPKAYYTGETPINCNIVFDISIHLGVFSNGPSDLNLYDHDTKQFGILVTLPYRVPYGNPYPDFAFQLFFPNGDYANEVGNKVYFRSGLKQSYHDWMPANTNFISNIITPTNETYLGKKVYTKVITAAANFGAGTSQNIAHGITGYDQLWVDTSNSYMRANDVILPLPCAAYYGNFSDRINFQINGANITMSGDTGWGTRWQIYLTIKYTKS